MELRIKAFRTIGRLLNKIKANDAVHARLALSSLRL